jgi:mRNA interferase MazF
VAAKTARLNQGDIYWLQGDISPSDIRHPYVVIQDNLFNHSRIHTVVVCALTTNLKRASLPGNLLLEVGEGNLPKASVVEVSKVSSVEKAQLGAYIGSLSDQRIRQILDGLRFLQTSFFHDGIHDK